MGEIELEGTSDARESVGRAPLAPTDMHATVEGGMRVVFSRTS